MNLALAIPYEVLYIIWTLQKSNFEAYLVGGAVRDLLIQSFTATQVFAAQPKNKSQVQIIKYLQKHYQEINDYDFTTNATPAQIQSVFTNSFYTNEFGCVGIAYHHLKSELLHDEFELPKNNIKKRFHLNQPQPKNRIIDLANAKKIHASLEKEIYQAQKYSTELPNPPPFEITTFRSEGVYSDYRRPDEIQWGNSIKEDLERRDFTINALALSVNQATLNTIFSNKNISKSVIVLQPEQCTLVDHHQGIKDLAKQIICTVRDPQLRFQEDALRMLRAIRLACQLEFEIEAATLSSIKIHAQLIQKISWERIQIELLKMIASPQPARGIKLLDSTGLLQYLIPELIEAKGVEQGGHHDTDVWTHSLDSLDNCPSADPVVRLAALLHDIGKPRTYRLRNNQITFYNHEIVSSRIADKIAKRLKLSNDQRTRLFQLVRYHMFYYQPHHTDAAIRRMIKRIGVNYIDDILDLREGDRLGSGAKQTSWRLEELKDRIAEQLNQPLDLTDLAVDGHDLMTELKIKPGKILGKILNHLLELVMEDPDLNKKQVLLDKAEEFLKQEA